MAIPRMREKMVCCRVVRFGFLFQLFFGSHRNGTIGTMSPQKKNIRTVPVPREEEGATSAGPPRTVAAHPDAPVHHRCAVAVRGVGVLHTHRAPHTAPHRTTPNHTIGPTAISWRLVVVLRGRGDRSCRRRRRWWCAGGLFCFRRIRPIPGRGATGGRFRGRPGASAASREPTAARPGIPGPRRPQRSRS